MNKKTGLVLSVLATFLAIAPGYAQTLPCREFNTVVTIGGVQQPAWGTGCLQPDGTWQLVSNYPQQQAYTQAYVQPQPVYVVQQQPVVVHHYVERQRYRPRTSLSLGYSSSGHWGHRHHRGWGSGVGVGFGPYW